MVVLLAAILCFSSGACNMAAAGASRAGRTVIHAGLKLLEQNVGSAAGGLSASERRLLRKRGVKLKQLGERQALARVKARATKIVEELEDSSAIMMVSGAVSVLGGLMAFAAAVLLITGRSRWFCLAAMAVAGAGTALGLLTPLSVAPLALAKGAMLAFGALAAWTMKEHEHV